VGLRHWHKVGDEPSEMVDMPSCCAHELSRALAAAADTARQDHDRAVLDERRRIVRELDAALDGFSKGFDTVLRGRALELVQNVVDLCRREVRKVGCICPRVDVGTLGNPGATMPGYDPLCGVHEIKRLDP